MAITYGMYAQQFLQIDMDNDGLYVMVPGMSENWFKVRVDESGVCPVATHCRCSKFAHKGTCDHCEIVNSFYAKLYKSNIAKANEKALEQAIDISDALDEQYEEVAFSGLVLATTEGLENFSTVIKPAPNATSSSAKVRKQGNKLVPTLNGQAQSNQVPAWLAILPSRQKSKVA